MACNETGRHARNNERRLSHSRVHHHDELVGVGGREVGGLVTLVLNVVVVVTITMALSLAIFFHVSGITIANSRVCGGRSIVTTSRVGVNSGVFVADGGGATSKVRYALPCIRSTRVGHGLSKAVAVGVATTATGLTVSGNSDFALISSGNGILRSKLVAVNSNVVVVSSSPIVSTMPKRAIRFRSGSSLNVVGGILALLRSGRLDKVADVSIDGRSGVGLMCGRHIAILLKLSSSIGSGVSFMGTTLAELSDSGPSFANDVSFAVSGGTCLDPRHRSGAAIPFVSPWLCAVWVRGGIRGGKVV